MQKKIIALLLVMVMLVVAVAACADDDPAPPPAPPQEAPPAPPAPPPAPPAPPAPPPAPPVEAGISGQFTGTSPGFQGPIEVQITVEDDTITAIEYLAFGDTQFLTLVAQERIVDQIIEHQSLGVDTVSGVTISSFGIISAIANAAEAAGLDVLALRQAPVNITPGAEIVTTTDVLVIGGGGGGFAAALSAAQAGADVVLIEKASVFGGNTMMAGGAINAANPAVQAYMIMGGGAYNTLRGIQNSDINDPRFHFDTFPEWQPILVQVQGELTEFFNRYSDRTPGVDMPGFDSNALHKWHMFYFGLRDMLDGSVIASRLDMATIMVENALDAFAWLRDLDAVIIDYHPDQFRARDASVGFSTVPGAGWTRTHPTIGAPGVTVGEVRRDGLVSAASGLGVTFMTDTRGTGLITDANGAVVGARAVCMVTGTEMVFNTNNGVILATGGFGDNAAMAVYYDNFWGPDYLTPRTLSTNKGTLRGDGIVMARELGAAVTADMGAVQFLPHSSPISGCLFRGGPVWGSAERNIYLDMYARRFVSEYAGRDDLTRGALSTPNRIMYSLFAGPIVDVSGEGLPVDRAARGVNLTTPGIQAQIANGYIWVGGTIRELYEHTQSVQAKNVGNAWTYEMLRAAIEGYNEIVVNQYDPYFNKAVIDGFIDIEYIENNPDVGIAIGPRAPSIHHTMGGLLVDTDLRVIREDGSIIENLWALGEVVGGIHAGNRLGGNALTDVFVFGRIAGENAANS